MPSTLRGILMPEGFTADMSRGGLSVLRKECYEFNASHHPEKGLAPLVWLFGSFLSPGSRRALSRSRFQNGSADQRGFSQRWLPQESDLSGRDRPGFAA